MKNEVVVKLKSFFIMWYTHLVYCEYWADKLYCFIMLGLFSQKLLQMHWAIHCLKDCARHIFASLFCKSKGEHLWNKEKNFSDIQISWFIKFPSMKHGIHFTKYLGSKHSLVMKFVYRILQREGFPQKIIWKLWPGN